MLGPLHPDRRNLPLAHQSAELAYDTKTEAEGYKIPSCLGFYAFSSACHLGQYQQSLGSLCPGSGLAGDQGIRSSFGEHASLYRPGHGLYCVVRDLGEVVKCSISHAVLVGVIILVLSVAVEHDSQLLPGDGIVWAKQTAAQRTASP